MNKITFNLFFALLLANLVPLMAIESTVEIRAAAFFPSSERFRNIYGNAGTSYQVEGSTELYDCVDGWANFDWFSKHGHSIGLSDPTHVSIANFSFGVKFPYRFCQQSG